MSLLLPAAALLLAATSGCGDDKDWDAEITLQLFRPKTVTFDDLVIKATQAGTTRQASLKDDPAFSFADCETNRVRLIPKPGSLAPVTISVLKNDTVLKKQVTLVEREIKLPVSGSIKLALGPTTDLLPAGCKPTEVPDGGVDGPANRPTGFMCSANNQCVGGLCITSYLVGGISHALKNGYCSRDCAKNMCLATYEFCYDNKDGLGVTQSKHCLKTCSLQTDCRVADGYECTPGGVCLPK